MLRYILPLLICFYKTSYASPSNDSLVAYVSADTVKRNQTFEIGIKGTHNEFTIEESSINDFMLIGGPITSRQMHIVNGVTSTSASKSLKVIATVAGDYNIAVTIRNRDSVEVYNTKVVVLNDVWTDADEAEKRANTLDPFDDPFFDIVPDQKVTSANTSSKVKKIKPVGANITGFQPQFETYNATPQNAAGIRYLITFDKMDGGYYSIGNISIIKMPSAKNVYIEVKGQGKLSNGNEQNNGYTKYIELSARCVSKGRYILSPLVILYNGKKYRSKKTKLVIGSNRNASDV